MEGSDKNGVIAFFDAAYGDGVVGAACVLADEWTTPAGRLQIRERLEVAPAEYEPGKFYLREMPHILRLNERLPAMPDVLVVDGYVWLDGSSGPRCAAVRGVSGPLKLAAGENHRPRPVAFQA